MRFGIAETDITPSGPVALSGYGYDLGRVSDGVDSPLKAYAVAFEDGEGSVAVLAGADVISVDFNTVDAIGQIVASKTQKDTPETILINASHTHSGPATHLLHGAGEYNDAYVGQIFIPKMSSLIVDALKDMQDGDIEISRINTTGLSYNRVDEKHFDQRLTAIGVVGERRSAFGVNFPCHPVVYGKDFCKISYDFPGYARSLISENVSDDLVFWQTGCAGEIDPAVNRDRKGSTSKNDVRHVGEAIGEIALDDSVEASIFDGRVRSVSSHIQLPVDVDFELIPEKEVEIFREAKGISKRQNLSGLKSYYKRIFPIVNSYENSELAVPVTVVAIGRLAFVGFGAEVFSSTGLRLEAQNPDLEIVTMMNVNGHQGYVPPVDSYDTPSYASRFSAYLFGRKPLLASSENTLLRGAQMLLDELGIN